MINKTVRFALIIGAMFVVSCGGGAAGGGSAKMDIKVGGKDTSLSVKSGGGYRSTKTFTAIDGKITTASSFYTVMANYEMDTASLATMKKPLTSAEQSRVTIQLIGEEGTEQNNDLKPGIYKADPSQKYMKVDSISVVTFADGKETNTNFDTNFSSSKITGQVEVTSVTADAISGKIDVTEGDKSIKGTFTAKMPAKNKN